MNTDRLKGKWALITGSSRGIGQQIAKALAKLGCNVAVHGRKIENNHKTLELIKAYGVQTISVAAELSSPEQIKTMADQVLQQTGGIDILYNNAGIMSHWHSIDATPAEELQRVFQINYYSVIQLCSIFAPGMKKRGFGRIINLTTGMQNEPSLFVYSTSKAALDKYTKELAFEYRNDNVLVNYLDPGWLKTDLGGQNAHHEVETVIPGAIVPALLEDNGPTGQLFRAQDYKYLSL